jgi:DNA-binding MarR family transcriptional regulator
MIREHLMNQDVQKSREALIDELGTVVRAQQRANDLFDQAVVDRFGLNRTDGRVVDLLQERGPMAAGEVARAVRLTTGAVTAVVDRLVERGIVQRMDDPRDRRRVLIAITDMANRYAMEMYGPLVREGDEMLANFTTAELAAIIEFLRLDTELHERHTEHLAALPPLEKPAGHTTAERDA